MKEHEEYTLIAVAGRTDPIRLDHDGPILHIIRNYHPKRVVVLLSEEIGAEEREYHYIERAIRLLDKECDVKVEFAGFKNVHSYDDFSLPLLKMCNAVKEACPDDIILLDITSGTPQLETALCMIALSDAERYRPIQVSSPKRSSNKALIFDPSKDSLEEWYSTNLDNQPGAEKRCHEPQLINFKWPRIQSQILSLVYNYDYAGAYQIYEENKTKFSRETGLLLEHARRRLNLEDSKAKEAADKLDRREKLYPVKYSDIERLVEFYNRMHVKQIRNELNDFVLRIGILTQYLAIYLLESVMGVSLDDIAVKRSSRNTNMYKLDRNKCSRRLPGIEKFMDDQYINSKRGNFDWNREINAQMLVQIIEFIVQSNQNEFKEYRDCVKEMQKWAKLSSDVRNPAAHTITTITDEVIRKYYDGKTPEILCKKIQKVMGIIFGNRVKKEVFEMYGTINTMIHEAMEK